MAEPVGPESAAPGERRVLVVEDDPNVQALLVATLSGVGYRVETMESALGMIGEVKRLQPCAIVLDLGLPYRSGMRLLADLKADPAVAAIPVIIVSGLADQLPPARAALAAAVLSKPFHPATLVAAVRTACPPA